MVTKAEDVLEDKYDFTFDDGPEAGLITADDAGKLNAASSSVLTDVGPRPEIKAPPDTVIVLPGGIEREGSIIRSAEVRELTGADEEALAKVSGHPGRFVSALLKCGVVRVGEYESSPALLRELLIGDRDSLVLAISRATFGNEIGYDNIRCPYCEERLDIKIHLDDIPMKRMEDDGEREFDVVLRKGRIARVRLPTGNDQEILFESFDASGPEQNTILLSRCVLSLTDSNGKPKKVNNSKSQVTALGVVDRRAILKALADRTIGPEYDKVSFHHESCNREVTVEVSVNDLFRGL